MDRPTWEETKQAIHERDRGQCSNCLRSGDDVTLDVHHVVPRGRGGSDRLSNLVLLCRQCHDAVHDEDERAPRLRWYTNNEMDEDEFQLFRRFFKAIDIAKFDAEEGCWFIPVGDAMRILGVDDHSALEVDDADGTIPIAEFM